MDIATFVELASKWNSLGWAVQEQAVKSLDDSDRMDECNPNALRMLRDDVLKPMSRCGDDELEAQAKCQIELINERIGAGR